MSCIIYPVAIVYHPCLRNAISNPSSPSGHLSQTLDRRHVENLHDANAMRLVVTFYIMPPLHPCESVLSQCTGQKYLYTLFSQGPFSPPAAKHPLRQPQQKQTKITPPTQPPSPKQPPSASAHTTYNPQNTPAATINTIPPCTFSRIAAPT